jgi:hypothetical protein
MRPVPGSCSDAVFPAVQVRNYPESVDKYNVKPLAWSGPNRDWQISEMTLTVLGNQGKRSDAPILAGNHTKPVKLDRTTNQALNCIFVWHALR